MTEIINARFQEGGKEYSFNPNGLTIQPGDAVILSTTNGPEYGICTEGNHMVDEKTLVAPLRQVLRLATEADETEHAEKQAERKEHRERDHRGTAAVPKAGPKTLEQKAKEREALRICQQKIEQHKLDMHLVSADLSPDGKLLFCFTSENRVDFRALVKDLAATFHARIELRQIGVRDETKLLGGLGICGQPYCCSRFLDKFQPVSIKMAKTQSLSLNPTKISGACGRLMCCLKYEQDAYEDAVKRCPKNESFVECPDGVGDVVSVNLLREQVRVKLDDSTDLPKTYRVSEVRVVRAGKGRRPEDYTPPPKAELEKLRFIPEGEKEKPRRGQDRLSAALESIFSHEIEPAAPACERRGGERRRQGNRDKQAAPRPPKDRQAGPGPKPARSQPEKKPAEKKPPQEAKPARMDAPRPAGGGNGRSRRHYRSYKPKRQE